MENDYKIGYAVAMKLSSLISGQVSKMDPVTITVMENMK